MYVPEIANRRQGLEWLGLLGKGQHLERSITHLRKARAMVIEPHSTGRELCRRLGAPVPTVPQMHLYKSACYAATCSCPAGRGKILTSLTWTAES